MTPVVAAALAVALLGTAVGCGTDSGSASEPRGDCPTEPVEVAVTVNPWGEIIKRLGGDCARVTTVVASSTDPHDFEPAPMDIARLTTARLVVLNGLGYDEWARRAVGALDRRPEVVDAGEVAGRRAGDNPHVWYSPDVVRATSDAVTARLKKISPGAGGYFDARRADWERSLGPYDAEIDRIRSVAAGRTYIATEPVYDDMAAALGLRDVTPEGYRRAVMNGSEPAPGDVEEFRSILQRRAADVMVFNTQTEGSLTSRLRSSAQSSGVPVVEVTETVPEGTSSFVDWQVRQLRALAKALDP